MLDVDRITDFDQLKQVTHLLHKENQRLHQKLIKLTRELATLRGESAQRRLALEIGALECEIDVRVQNTGHLPQRFFNSAGPRAAGHTTDAE